MTIVIVFSYMKKWKVLCSLFSLGRDHKWCPVLATDNAGCHGGQDGWWLVQLIPVQFPPEAEMHSLLERGAFCSSQEKMVRSLMLLICKFSVSCSTWKLCGFSETWSLEGRRSKRSPWSWTTSPQCNVLYKQNRRDCLSHQVYGGIWITTITSVLRAASAL